MRIASLLLATVTALALFTPGTALAQPGQGITVRDESMKYTFKLGPGWQEMPAEMLNQQNEAVRQIQPGTDMQYSRGYVLVDTDQTMLAYMLVQQKAGGIGRKEIDDIARGMGAVDTTEAAEKAKRAAKDVITDLTISRPTFDRATGHIMIPASAKTVDGEIQGISHGYIGATGLVMLHSYTSKDSYPTLKPVFDAAASSITFDPGSTYADAQARESGSGGFFDSIGKYAVIGAVIGGVVALIAGSKKKQTPASPTA